jgi:hypothetical protein
MIFFGGEEKFEELKRHDNIKYNYCKKNKVTIYLTHKYLTRTFTLMVGAYE